MTTKPPVDPELYDVLQNLKGDIFRTLNCVKVGKITRFNRARKTAEVQILFRRELQNGTTRSMPVLVDCPVFTYQGGGASLRMPITDGDTCLLLFSDRNLDAWFKTGVEAVPFTPRVHDLSDGIALVGIDALTSSLADYVDDEAVWDWSGAKIALNDEGLITIQNEAQNLKEILDTLLTALGTAADFAAINTAATAAKTKVDELFY